MLRSTFVFLALFQLALCKTIRYDWKVSWVTAAPDGFSRPVIGINGQWPCPQIDANVGDTIVVNVYNDLGNQTTSIHWHGIHQKGTNYMDGSTSVTQCPIPAGGRMTYEFLADQSGTYWYHSHDPGQYPDGLWGPLIVRDAHDPYVKKIDGEIIITLTDWYHEQMPTLIKTYQSVQNQKNNSGDEPLPDAALINAHSNSSIHVEPNKTYLVRILCVGNFPGHALVFDKHTMTVVEVDGVWTDEYPVNKKYIRLATGQRMSVLMTTKNDTSQNYAIWDTLDINMLFVDEGKSVPKTYNANATAWLIYNKHKPLPPPPIIQALFNPDFVDDVNFVPHDHMRVLGPVDHQIVLDVNSSVIGGIEKFVINDSTYNSPGTPSLYTALTSSKAKTANSSSYGAVNPYILKHNEIVEIIINNHHTNLHPFHLHGHQFQVLERTLPNLGAFTSYGNYSATPMRRDTVMLQPNGYAVIRFKADNPGVWLFHCHVEWHIAAGFSATFIEAPDQLKSLKIPEDNIKICQANGTVPSTALPTPTKSIGTCPR